MDSQESSIHDREQELEDELLDEGEVYDEDLCLEGEEEIFLEDEIDVEDIDQIGEFIELPIGALVPANQHHVQHQLTGNSQANRVNRVLPRQPQQNHDSNEAGSSGSAHVYAIRGDQVYRVDKGSVTQVPKKIVKEELVAYADNDKSASTSSEFARSSYSPAPLRTNSSSTYGQNYERTSFSPTPLVANKRRVFRRPVIGMKKPCNCTKSQCLKLYCDCFANGEFCQDCNCKDCHNNMVHEGERSRAIRSSLERNPNAFKPKIGVSTRGRTENERLHQKGCHCKKSNCLKNYCECYEAKVACTDRCKCCGCKNTENDRMNKFNSRSSNALLSLANVATGSGGPQSSFPLLLFDKANNMAAGDKSAEGSKTKDLKDAQRASSAFSDEDSDEGREGKDPRVMPYFYMTDEVVEASTLCMVAKVEDLESRSNASSEEMERCIMEEFALCLESIIASATSAQKESANNRGRSKSRGKGRPEKLGEQQKGSQEDELSMEGPREMSMVSDDFVGSLSGREGPNQALLCSPSVARSPSMPAVTAVMDV